MNKNSASFLMVVKWAFPEKIVTPPPFEDIINEKFQGQSKSNWNSRRVHQKLRKKHGFPGGWGKKWRFDQTSISSPLGGGVGTIFSFSGKAQYSSWIIHLREGYVDLEEIRQSWQLSLNISLLIQQCMLSSVLLMICIPFKSMAVRLYAGEAHFLLIVKAKFKLYVRVLK